MGFIYGTSCFTLKYILILLFCIVFASSVYGLDVVWNDSITDFKTSNHPGWALASGQLIVNDSCIECPDSFTDNSSGGYWLRREVNDTISNITEPFIYRAYMEVYNNSHGGAYLQVGNDDLTFCNFDNCTYWGIHENSNTTSYVCPGDVVRTQGSTELINNTFYLFEVYIAEHNTEFYLNGNLEHNCTSTTGFMNYSSVDYVHISKEVAGFPGVVHIDNVSVLLFTGSEEEINLTPSNGTIDIFSTISDSPIIELSALTGSSSNEHNDLSGLQGGTTGQYYHLNFSAYSYLTANLFLFGIGNTSESNITDTIWNITGSKYLYNDTYILDVNETALNSTVWDIMINYTHLSNFTDDLGHIEDNTSFNQSLTDNRYLPHTIDTNASNCNDGEYLDGDGECYNLNSTVLDQLITDHGNLTGLTNDDHLQYLLINGSRNMTGNLTTTGIKTNYWYTDNNSIIMCAISLGSEINISFGALC